MMRPLIIRLLLLCAASSAAFVTAAKPQAQPLPIHDIQGSGATSPLVGQRVTTSGVVTASKSNGFFLQASDAEADNDPDTSEAIFVFTSQTPAVTTGQRIAVTGTVAEFRPASAPNSLPLTELTNPTINLLAANVPLPQPVTLTAADLNPAGALDQLEKYEAMRVRALNLVTVAPSGGSVNEQNATASPNGILFAVFEGSARPFREPGLEPFAPLPADAPCCVPRFDGNPERLRIDTRSSLRLGQPGGPLLSGISTGTRITSLTGPLDYTAGNYSILVDPPAITQPGLVFVNEQTILNAVPVPAPRADEFTVASFNMERFFDTIDDPNKSDAVLTPAAFATRVNKASLAIRQVLRLPDILGVQEVENLATLQTIAAKINGDVMASGAPNPNYQAFLVEGNDPGGIDVGFLVRGERVAVNDVMQSGKDTTYTDPTNNQPALLNDRPPLVLRAVVQIPAGGRFAVTVIVNHLRSLLGLDDPTSGARVRAKRRAQAEFLANLIQVRQAANPTELIVSVGDYNSFQFNDGYVDTIGTIKGTPTPAHQVVLASNDLVNPDLFNLIDLLPAAQRYSYVFDGNAQAIDHVLVTANLLPRVTRFHYARNNADFPEDLRAVANRPERVSDHDMPVAYFTMATVTGTVTNVSAASYTSALAQGESIISAFGTGLAATTAVATSLPLPTTLGGVTVTIRDDAGAERPAPLFFVSPTQINYLLPANVPAGQALVIVTTNNGERLLGRMLIERVAPSLFAANATGEGVAAAAVLRVRADGSAVYEPVARFDQMAQRFVAAPINLGAESDQVFLILFGTGLRQRPDLAAVSARLGTTNAEVVFAGAQGELVGLDQVNVRLPRTLAGSGEIDVVLLVEGKSSNAVKVNIR